MNTLVRLLAPFVLLVIVLEPSDAAASRGIELTLRGGFVARADGRRVVTALFALDVPLDRAAAPRVPVRWAEPEQKKEAPAPRARPLVTLVTPELAHAAVRAALRSAGKARTEARFASLSARARASAALPELRLRAARTTDESLRLTPTTTDPYRYTQAGGVSIALEAQATWRLDRAVFAGEELAVEQLRRQRARQEAKLVEDVLGTLFAWQRAVSGAFDPESSPEEQDQAGLRAVEAEVRLDLLTGGWFSPRALRLKKNALSRRRRSE